MGLFSKYPCVFCGNKVGFFKGKKIHGGDHICKECEKDCSSFIDVSKFDKEYLEKNKEYMEKQNILYQKEFEVLGKKELFRYVRNYYGIECADSIGMFRIITPKSEKKNKKELFRYDQVKDFRYYDIPNTNSQSNKAYAEAGLEIDFRSLYNKNGFKNPDVKEGTGVHPYLETIRIPLDKDTNNSHAASLVMGHLNRAFGRASDSIAGSIKEKFTGTGKQRATREASNDAFKALGSMAKAAIKKDDNAMENAKENLTNAAKDAVIANMNYGARYTKVADDAEKRAWNE